ncbi:MAG TPA: DUF4097 family beta strand repeat-containing protein [Candidatus Binataceae bacterium]|nr:DUF4097 family beta strand repeat-containing protein [Candidatus Binataceae bacterium]
MLKKHSDHRNPVLLRRARLMFITVASIGLFLAGFAIPKAFAEDGVFEQALSGVPEDAVVHVTTASGDVNVRPSDGDQVLVQGKIHIDPEQWNSNVLSPQGAIDRLEHDPPIEQNGSTIRIGSIDDPDLSQNISISYTVKIPSTAKLKIRIGSGSLDVHQLGNDVDASTASGHVTITDIKGAVRASSKSGAVDVRSITGTATVAIGSGPTNGEDLAAPKVKSTSGPVTFHNVHGSCDVSVNSGDIKVDGDPSQAWDLHTSAGNVAISVAQPADFQLNAQTETGDIHNDLPLSQFSGGSSGLLAGSVGNGGPKIDLSTDSGDISIE